MLRSTTLMMTLITTLAGCATVSGMPQSDPNADYTTAKPAAAIESCLTSGVFNWLSAPGVIRGGSSTEVVFGPFKNAVLHITLAPVPSGTVVEVRQQVIYGPRSRRTIEACLE